MRSLCVLYALDTFFTIFIERIFVPIFFAWYTCISYACILMARHEIKRANRLFAPDHDVSRRKGRHFRYDP